MSALLFEKDGHAAIITINRPESRNPLGEQGDGERFSQRGAAINEDREIRCAILTGAGPAFSAGGNLKAMRERAGSFGGGPASTSASGIATVSIASSAHYGELRCR